MKKMLPYITLVAVLIAIPSLTLAKHVNNLVFHNYGFSITPPVSDDIPSSPVTFRLLCESGNTATVDVQILSRPDHFSIYIDRKMNALRKQNVEFIKEYTYSSSAKLEYRTAGEESTARHIYQKYICIGRKVYVATGVACEADWDDIDDEIEDCINSIEVFSVTDTYSHRVTTFKSGLSTSNDKPEKDTYKTTKSTKVEKKRKKRKIQKVTTFKASAP